MKEIINEKDNDELLGGCIHRRGVHIQLDQRFGPPAAGRSDFGNPGHQQSILNLNNFFITSSSSFGTIEVGGRKSRPESSRRR
jgi:hypothetical protein